MISHWFFFESEGPPLSSKINVESLRTFRDPLILKQITGRELLFGSMLQGVPHLHGFHYCDFWLMYMQVWDFRVSRGPLTVPLNTVFFKSQNPHNVGTLCTYYILALALAWSEPHFNLQMHLNVLQDRSYWSEVL